MFFGFFCLYLKMSTDRERAPIRVIGLVDDPEGGFGFLLELMNGTMKMMPRSLAHQICPQLVIEYYRSIFEWKDNRQERTDGSEDDSFSVMESSLWASLKKKCEVSKIGFRYNEKNCK